MKNINWKQKLSSRKFWIATSGLITSIMFAFGADAEAIEKVGAVLANAAVVCMYLFVEGEIDKKRIEFEEVDESEFK